MSSNSAKHPKALPICFLTEMWERFGNAIIASTVVFILIQRFDLPDNRANLIVGAFTAMLYITSVLSGQVADKLLGYYRSVLLGGVFLIVGYTILAFTQNLLSFCFALGVVCSGTGCLKTNVGSYLGHSYKPEDKHRQSGFTIFYVGINLGALLGLSCAGYLSNNFGEKATLLTAATMLVIGTLGFYYGFKKLELPLYRKHVSFTSWILGVIITIIGTLISLFVMYNSNASDTFLVLIIILSLVIVLKGAKNLADLKKAVSYLLFLAIATVFWSLYNQIFMSMNLFIDRLVDHTVLGFLTIPTQAFLVFNAGSVLAGGVILGVVWKYINLLDIYKYIIGMFILMFMFVSVVVGIHMSGTNSQNLINGNWVVLCYICLGLAELFVSAIGLSLATRLAPKGQIGGYMGLWLVNTGIGAFFAGIIANFAAIPNKGSDIIKLKQIYLSGFSVYITIAVVAFIFTIVAIMLIKKLLGEEA